MSVRENIDSASGAIVSRREYHPYGRGFVTGSGPAASMAFTGHSVDESLDGLLLTLYRVYDAHLGQWLNEDPLRFGGGLNFFQYVDGNPIRKMDPFGLQTIECKNCSKEQEEAAGMRSRARVTLPLLRAGNVTHCSWKRTCLVA
jgi:RHS repeat-associated protein